MIKIAIDAMGSDAGSAMVVEAVKKFQATYKDVELYVVGKASELEEISSVATIIDAKDVMGMEDGALEVLRRKESSMLKALDLVVNKTCAGICTAGSTAAFLTGATIKLKMIPGIVRGAYMSPFPTEDGKGVVVLDLGANNENTPEHLVQFAKMGNVFAEKIWQRPNPKVYLLSNGSEENKGSPVGKEAYQILKKEEKLNFCGNLEARDVLSGKADVIVCDGYAGNILLKTLEGSLSLVKRLLKEAFMKSKKTKMGYLLTRSALAGFAEKLDYKQYGGGLLVGVNGVAVKAHGNSDALTFYHAIRLTYELIKGQVVEQIGEAMKNG
ncbi:phosphate acyltransferase PlsX [bacterium]|jgi:glycerol-3-phosphate acyltransferase PlsX|nr:phosphate acyltransferase PlsX [bacterium]